MSSAKHLTKFSGTGSERKKQRVQEMGKLDGGKYTGDRG
jgi:hypothetical protein